MILGYWFFYQDTRLVQYKTSKTFVTVGILIGIPLLQSSHRNPSSLRIQIWTNMYNEMRAVQDDFQHSVMHLCSCLCVTMFSGIHCSLRIFMIVQLWGFVFLPPFYSIEILETFSLQNHNGSLLEHVTINLYARTQLLGFLSSPTGPARASKCLLQMVAT